MSEILIVSKTKMGRGYCVGGLGLSDNKSLRLLRANGYNQSSDCAYDVGQIWECTYIPSPSINPPHAEDVLVSNDAYLRDQADLSTFLRGRCLVWTGSPSKLFDGFLSATGNGKGFISQNKIPNVSTGYWSPQKDLHLEDEDTYRYNRLWLGVRRIKYVGVEEPIDPIPAGTLVRVSLARWWSPRDSNFEERCYLQLSGWYR